MSPTDPNMPGIKGKRVPGRPGRFDPSEPLHMTTRRRANRPSNGSPSVNGSVDDDDSRKSSIDDIRPLTSHSNGSQHSLQSRRPSEVFLPNVTPDNSTNGFSFVDENKDTESMTKPISPYLHPQSPSPSRKRKRSTSPTTHTLDPSLQSMDDVINVDAGNDVSITEPDLEDDAIEVVPPEDLSDREASPHTSHSEDDEMQLGPYSVESMDITPAVSNPASPESGESGEDQPLEDALGAALANIEQDVQDDDAEAIEDMDVDVEAEVADEDDVEDADDVEDVEDAEEQLRSDDDERPVRRFGGRRRAQHPIPKVEKAMQRQAELKSAYRALARQLKPVLAEIAQRTTDDLSTQPELHLETREYESVEEGLDAAFEARRDRLHAQLQLNQEQLQRTLEIQQRSLKERCVQKLRDLKEFRLARLEHEIMQTLCEAQRNSVDAGYLTDDEDTSTSKLKGGGLVSKQAKVGNAFYDSRSRLVLETVRATNDIEQRFEMRKLLDGLEEEDRVDVLKGFTVMDDHPRKAAAARREVYQNMRTMAQAAAEVERLSNIPVIPNKEAQGLQLLGDLASRPSITAPPREPLTAKQRRESASQQTPTRPIPPQLQIPTNYRPSPIPVEMSPRTTQALGDRFENSMPPPVTPRQRTTLFMRSPEATRAEQTLPSPTLNSSRFNSSQDYTARAADRWAEARRATFAEQNRGPIDNRRPPDTKQDAVFSPQQTNERKLDYPLWREYPREAQPNTHRRTSSHNERPAFNLGMRAPSQDDRRNDLESRPQEMPVTQDALKMESSPFSQLQSRLSRWQDPSSQAGATDGRSQDQKPISDLPRRPTLDARSPPLIRNPTVSFSAREFRPTDVQRTDNQQQQQPKYGPPKSNFQMKTNKEERDGLSRRHWSMQKRFSKSLGSFRPENPLTNASSAGSPVERGQPPAPWRGAPQPQNSPPSVPPPPPTYQQSPYSQPPPMSSYRPTQGQEHYQQRTSFTPRPTSSTHDRLPPTPLYVVPQSQPPPPGVPPEQYNRPFAPPPPPGYQPPSAPQQPPQTAYSPSGPGSSFTSQFGGPPLAPAGASLYHSNIRPAPAFAQQAQQQQSTFGNRRRTQSDASQQNNKFHTWVPPSQRRL